MLEMSSQSLVESTTEYNYPSKRKKIVNHKGEVIYDSDKDNRTIPNTNYAKLVHAAGIHPLSINFCSSPLTYNT